LRRLAKPQLNQLYACVDWQHRTHLSVNTKVQRDLEPMKQALLLISEQQQIGRAIIQAVSHWLPTAAARVRSRVRSCGTCGGRSGTGAGFLLVFRFPLPILIPPNARHSSSWIMLNVCSYFVNTATGQKHNCSWVININK
jgi:hypothetical protein